MAWDKNSQEGQFITGLDAERVIVNEMRKKVTERIMISLISLVPTPIGHFHFRPTLRLNPGTTVSLSDVSF